MDYQYYFGVKPTLYSLSSPIDPRDTASKSNLANPLSLRPWELKHVTSFSESTGSKTSTIGLPNKPAECTFIYDAWGPVRTFSIDFDRYDNEEQVSNLDFVHTQFCDYLIYPTFNVPHKGSSTSGEGLKVVSIGLEWMLSFMQAISQGFILCRVAADENAEPDGRIPLNSGTFDGRRAEFFTVALTSISYDLDSENPGIMHVSLSLTERKPFEYAPAYKRYVPSVRPRTG